MTADYSWNPAPVDGKYVGGTRRQNTLDAEETYIVGTPPRQLYFSPLFSSWVLERPNKVLPLRISEAHAQRLCGK